MNNKRQNRILFGVWVVLALMFTVAIGFTYTAVLQNYRQTANDPQIELAREVVKVIEQGAPPDQIIAPGARNDISESLAPFVIIFDKDGKVVGSSANLEGDNAVPPKGSMEFAKAKGKNYFTWQPKEGVRVAAVLLPAKDSFVLVGKNIREVENRIQQAMYMSLGTWITLLGLSVIFAVMLKMLLLSNTIIEQDTEVVVIEERGVL